MPVRLLLLLVLFLLPFHLKAQQRIVTAGSSSSEIVCALGACDNIVATDLTSKYPEKLQSLPSIGYRSGINAEGIIARRPNLVIMENGYVKEALISQLEATGIQTLIVEQEYSLESTRERIRAIASAINREGAGEELITKIENKLANVKARVNQASSTPSVLCVYARGQGNLQVGGTGSAFTLLDVAGARNAVPQIEGFKPLNTESLIQANPDFILFFSSGLASIGGVEGALNITGVAQTTAGKKQQIIAMDGLLLTNWGPRVAEAAEQLLELTHPELQAR